MPAYRPMVYVIRAGHLIIGLGMTAATVMIWVAAIWRVLNIWTWLALLALAVQWTIVGFNHGHCPLGVVHARYGDEKTLFELVAGKKYAKYGFRNWAIVCAAGGLLLLFRLTLS